MCKSLIFHKNAGLRSQASNFFKKESPIQMFTFGFCKTFKGLFFTEYFRVTTSDVTKFNERNMVTSRNLAMPAM